MNKGIKQLNQTLQQSSSLKNRIEKDSIQTCSSFSSQYKQIYEEMMKNVENLYTKQEIIQKLIRFNIYYRQQQNKDNEIHFTILKHTLNYEAIILKMSYCGFQTEISLLNIQAQFQYQNIEIGAGSFGQVYLYHNNRQLCAIKNIGFDSIKFQLKIILRQYFFNILMSALQCGPKISKVFGFDLLLFSNSAAFAMELCQKICSLGTTQKKQLCQSMKMIHSLNIIHGDIKPQNIVYSEHFKKVVFCDFGLMKRISQPIGQKSFTHFFGSIVYVSPQMFKLLQKQQFGYIDLYYNDAITLKNSFNNFFPKQKQKKWSQQQQFIVSNEFEIYFQKYLVFMNHFQHIDKILKQKQFLEFLLILEPSHQIYRFFIEYFGMEENIYTKYTAQLLLREIYTSAGISQTKWKSIISTLKIINFKNRLKFIQSKNNEEHLKKNIQMKQLQKILKSQQINKQKLCILFPHYLLFWREQTWKNAQSIVHHCYNKLFNLDQKKKKNNKQIKKIVQKKEKQFINSNYQFMRLLAFMGGYFYQLKDYQSLLRLAEFQENFFIQFSHLQFRILALEILFKMDDENQVKAVVETLIYIIINMAPLQFDFIIQQFIIGLKKIKEIATNNTLKQELTLYEQFFENNLLINRQNHLQIDFQSYKVEEKKYSKSYRLTRLCIQIKISTVSFDFSRSLSLLNQLQNQIEDDRLISKKYYKRFIKQSYIYIYQTVGSSKGSALAEEYIYPPKSFEKLWKIRNRKLLTRKYKATKNWYEFTFHVKQYLMTPSIGNYPKLITMNLYTSQIKKFYNYFKDILTKLIYLCFRQVQDLASNVNFINRQKDKFFFYILNLYSMLNQIAKYFNKKELLIKLEQIFKKYSHLALPQQYAKISYLKLLSLYEDKKYFQAIQYYEQLEIKRLPPKQQNRCGMLITICQARIRNFSKAQSLASNIYYKSKQYNDLYFLVGSTMFFNILQHIFHVNSMLKQHIQLLTTILKYLYLHKELQKVALIDFIKQITIRYPDSAVRISDYFIKSGYYVSKNISLHNFSALLLTVMEKFNYGCNIKKMLLRNISMTIDSLSNQIKTIVKPKYYRLLSKCYKGRKQKWIKTKYSKNKINKKIVWITTFKKHKNIHQYKA